VPRRANSWRQLGRRREHRRGAGHSGAAVAVAASGGSPQRLTKLARGAGHPPLAAGAPRRQGRAFHGGGKPGRHGGCQHPGRGLTDRRGQGLAARGYYGRYLPGGYLVYVNQGVLYGEPFDAGKLEARGAPEPLLEDVPAMRIGGEGSSIFRRSRPEPGARLPGGAENVQRWPIVWTGQFREDAAPAGRAGHLFQPAVFARRQAARARPDLRRQRHFRL